MASHRVSATEVWLLGTALAFCPPARAANDACLECHGQADLTVALKSGDILALTIQSAAWAKSVHATAGMACTDCHAGLSEYPHPDLPDQTRRELSLRLYTSCQPCHEDQYKRTLDSVHQRALAAGNPKAAVCTDCHDPHTQRRLTDAARGTLLPAARTNIPQTCARCHDTVFARYRQSAHGAALIGEGNPDVPTCIDCHGVHNIGDPTTARFRLESPKLCADCHTNARRMAKYGLSTQVLKTYVADFHGSTVTLFRKQHPDQQTNKPVCFDCHGVHDIPHTHDPEKGLRVKANLLATCQRCHPQATTNFPDAWLSHYIPTPQRNPLVYWTGQFYRFLIPGVVGGMLLFVSTDFLRRRIDGRRERQRREPDREEKSPEGAR